MASSSKSAEKVKNVNGYIHELSEIQIGKTTGNRYFDFKVQEDESEFTRVACFSPEKRDVLKRKQESKDPVCLMNVSPQKKKYKPDIKEYTMGKYSSMVDGDSLYFPWKLSPEADTNPVSIEDIFAKKEVGESIWFRGKVISISDPYSVYSSVMEKILQKRDLIVADPTGAMFLSLWDGLVDQVEIQRLYLFTNVKVAFFKKRFLNTTSKSVISVLEESIGLPRKVEERVKILEMQENNIEKFRGKILSAEVSQTYVCINCKGRIHEDQQCQVSCQVSAMQS
jgi:hypothetical protein